MWIKARNGYEDVITWYCKIKKKQYVFFKIIGKFDLSQYLPSSREGYTVQDIKVDKDLVRGARIEPCSTAILSKFNDLQTSLFE